MQRVTIIGVGGFVGRNLRVALARRDDVELAVLDLDADKGELAVALADCDVVYHLPGVRPHPDPTEGEAVSPTSTATLCRLIGANPRHSTVVVSLEAKSDSERPHNCAERADEQALASWAEATAANLAIFRLPCVFGKWRQPNRDSLVATVCHNVAHSLPIKIDDPTRLLALVYIDDVVASLLAAIEHPPSGFETRQIEPSTQITVGAMAEMVGTFRASQHAADLQDFEVRFERQLYATYLSYLEPSELSFALELKRDDRGDLVELLRQPHVGQIFVSRTRPGVTRGNHYHDTKVERFLVLQGEGIVRLRRLYSTDVLVYPVSGIAPRVVIIPPGTTHSIQNVGPDDMLTLFWADEVFDPDCADTYSTPVLLDEGER